MFVTLRMHDAQIFILTTGAATICISLQAIIIIIKTIIIEVQRSENFNIKTLTSSNIYVTKENEYYRFNM